MIDRRDSDDVHGIGLEGEGAEHDKDSAVAVVDARRTARGRSDRDRPGGERSHRGGVGASGSRRHRRTTLVVAGPGRSSHRAPARRVGPAAVADRARGAGRGHDAHPGHHDGRDDERRPPQPAQPRIGPGLRPHHADRWRHGRPRVGSGLPPRPLAAPLPAVRLEHGLVRRDAGVPLLHGRARPGDRGLRHDPAVRRGLQADRRLRARDAAVLLLGLRSVGPLPLPDPRAVRLRRPVLRPRRELQHLRRQPQVDDGRRVLVLHRPQPRHPRPRSAGQRHADGQVPQLGGHRARPVRRQPRHRGHLRRPLRRRHRAVERRGSAPARLRAHRRTRRRSCCRRSGSDRSCPTTTS